MRMRLACVLALISSAALAQSGVAVKQSGNVTPNQVPWWVSSGVIGGGVTSGDSPVTSFGVTNNGLQGICVNSDRIAAAGRNTLCLGTQTNGVSQITVQNYGTTTAQPFQFVINGTTITPAGGATALTIGSTTIGGGVDKALLYDNAGVLGNIITSATGAYYQFQNLTGGQWVGVPVNAYGAVNDNASNSTRYLVDAATYANTNRLGMMFSSQSAYRQTPIQYGGSYIYTCTFTGSIGPASTALAVTTTPGCQLAPGMSLTGAGVSANTRINSYTGKTSGFIGSYGVNNSQTVGPITFTATAPSCTADFSGTTMTVTACANGSLNLVDAIQGTGVIAGQTIAAFGTGTGTTGTYTMAYSQPVALTSVTIRANPYTVVPIPDNIMGAVGGETQTIVRAFGANTSPHALIKIQDSPGLGAVLGFQLANLRIDAASLYGNAVMLHGFSSTSAGGIPVAANLTLSGGTSASCNLNMIGNSFAGGSQIVESRLSDIELRSATVCDVNMDGNDGNGSYNIQSVLMSNVKANSASSGNGWNIDYANPTIVEGLSQNHTGVPIAFDHTFDVNIVKFYSEGDVAGAATSTANTFGVKMTGTLVGGVDANLRACQTCNIDIHIGTGLGTYPTNTQRNAGAINATSIMLNAAAPSNHILLGNGTSYVDSAIPAATIVVGSTAITSGTSNGVLTNSSGVLANTAAGTNGQLFLGVTAGQPVFATMSGDATITNAGALALATVATAGTTGSSTAIPVITINAKGLTTSITTAAVVAPAGTLTGATLAAGVTASSLTSLGTITSLTATTINAFTLGGTIAGGGNQINNVIIGASTPLAGTFTTLGSGAHTITSASATALTVGLNGATNPAFTVDASTASQAAGWKVTGAATGGTVAMVATDSGSNTNVTINAKGSGTLGIGSVSTGAVTITPQLILGNSVSNGLAFKAAGGSTDWVIYEGAGGALNFTAGSTPTLVLGNALDYNSTTASTTTIAVAATFSNATVKMTALATDAATTDSTLCIKSSDGTLLKGSGTLGICLGTSSERYKNRITDIVDGLDEVTKLRPVNFYYKKDMGHDPAKLQFGFTAEQVFKVLPALVDLDEQHRPNTVDILGMVPIIVRSVQQLKSANDNFEARLAKLEARK